MSKRKVNLTVRRAKLEILITLMTFFTFCIVKLSLFRNYCIPITWKLYKERDLKNDEV